MHMSCLGYEPAPGRYQPVWSYVVKFAHFGKIFKLLGNFARVFYYLAKYWTYFGKICMYTFGQFFIDENGQMLTNNLAIFSHWHIRTYLPNVR